MPSQRVVTTKRCRAAVTAGSIWRRRPRRRPASLGLLLEPELAQGRVVVGTAAERPMIFALAFLDRRVVDAGDAQAHQAVRVEFPVLVAIAAEPGTAVVVPLIGEAHGDAVVAEGPELLDQTVVEFAPPFARQERLDGVASVQELHAIAPAAIAGIGERNARRVARVPGILGLARLLRGGFGGGGGERRTGHVSCSSTGGFWRPPRPRPG